MPGSLICGMICDMIYDMICDMICGTQILLPPGLPQGSTSVPVMIYCPYHLRDRSPCEII